MRIHFQRGLSLPEILILACVSGVIISLAIPAAQDHVSREKVTRAVGSLGFCRATVESYFYIYDRFPTHLHCECEQAAKISPDIHHIAMHTDGSIVITLEQGVTNIAGQTIILTPHLDIDTQLITHWRCDGTVFHRHRPRGCQ